MGERIKRVLTVLLLAGGFVLAVQAPASASYSECFIGNVCIWDNLNGTGNLVFSAHAQPPGTCYPITGSGNDRGRSFYNHMGNGRHVQFYEHSCAQGLGHGLHKQCGQDPCGGATAPFADGEVGSFYRNAPAQPLHNDRLKASAIFFNTG